MPLKSGKSRKTISENVREFHKGPKFAKAKAKFGKAKANKQAVAAALSKARHAKAGKKFDSGNYGDLGYDYD